MGGAKRYPSLHFIEVMGFAELNSSYTLRRDGPRACPPRLVAHNDIYLVVQSVQAAHQTIDREFADAAGDKRGNIRLLESEHDGSPGLGKLPAFEDSTDFANKLGLEKLFFRIGKPEVGKNITAARGYFFGVAHFVRPFP
jgi:hypothetical protein